MNYKPLGNTGLQVSEIALGTAEIGMDYGFRGSVHYHPPGIEESIRLLCRAVDSGINLIDTARVYGISEQLVGKALQEMHTRPYILSKVYVPIQAQTSMTSQQLRAEVFGSLEASLRALQVEAIDLMLIHSATLETLNCQEYLACLDEARQQGKIRFLGASIYEEEEALEALNNKLFRTLQVPFNLLDQTLSRRVFGRAHESKVGIFVRSVFLRGVLTSQVNSIPQPLSPLREAAFNVTKALGEEVTSLAEAAVRFCLSFDEVSSVILGMRSTAELESNLDATSRGPLSPEALRKLQDFSREDDPLVDPRNWHGLT